MSPRGGVGLAENALSLPALTITRGWEGLERAHLGIPGPQETSYGSPKSEEWGRGPKKDPGASTTPPPSCPDPPTPLLHRPLPQATMNRPCCQGPHFHNFRPHSRSFRTPGSHGCQPRETGNWNPPGPQALPRRELCSLCPLRCSDAAVPSWNKLFNRLLISIGRA